MRDPKIFISNTIKELRSQVKGRAVAACSGGVDSTTAARIASEALGDRLTAVFVDTGFLRKGEPERVREYLTKLGLKMRFVDAEEEFFAALSGVIDPEAKRHRVGEEFIKVFKRVAQEVGAGYLIQGTIAPDWIESGGGLRDRIKSHHNVGGLPERLNLILVEPLRDLYKDEIRELARYLKIEELYHQPFPGPGLAVRIAGEVTPKRVELVREACAIVEEEIERAAERKEIALPWQYFAMLLSARAVGVRGDLRSYGYAVMIRAIESTDGMTAAPSRLPYPVLERIAARITSSLKEVTRVGYEVTGKPPATIEWE